jgi:MarR-like DNA-binding transcriptional regulator SgrR of sgrS sRNA
MVSHHAKRQLLATLHECIPPEGGKMSMNVIAQRAGYTRRHVITILKVLEHEGALLVEHRPGAPLRYRWPTPPGRTVHQ